MTITTLKLRKTDDKDRAFINKLKDIETSIEDYETLKVFEIIFKGADSKMFFYDISFKRAWKLSVEELKMSKVNTYIKCKGALEIN